MKSMKSLSLAAMAASFLMAATSAMAQGIEVKNQAFVNDVQLPIGKPKVDETKAALNVNAVVPNGKAWEIRLKDINLANTFQRWGAEAGWRVRWDAKKNFMVEAPDALQGSFEDAVKSVLAAPGIATSEYPLEVCFYPNTPPLARITRKGEQDKECN